ncbi:immunity 49 family protein [Streptomyces clavuligerus]|uniref:immunity 49 family protein n=4 Tax=Streptomyces clavuligerus TaxID=1901 RepID=UPI0001851EC7|nr:immunity 49 family protein [Streptomyces clavuligerus]WDN56072.1 immunity 49 family protein [Streptomyces clavuligerus]
MEQALADITGRAYRRWTAMASGTVSPAGLLELQDELLDHVAAAVATDPEYPDLDDLTQAALLTAAECSLGALSAGCFPEGDQSIRLPLLETSLTNDNSGFRVTGAPCAAEWLDAFALCVVSGLVWDWQRVFGLMLRFDYAPAIRDGFPHSPHTAVSDPADLAAMDTLCLYLTPARSHLPSGWPTLTLRKPDPAERAAAARALDTTHPTDPDHRLLRVLLDDDREQFEDALATRLTEHRRHTETETGTGASPRTLLPVRALALASLADQTHRWPLRIASGYLPAALIGSSSARRHLDEATRARTS